MVQACRVVAIIPALNEEAVIGRVVGELVALTDSGGKRLFDEVLVTDNGSSDQTRKIASAAGARVIAEPRRGYGSACLAAMATLAHCDVVVFVDGDGSVDAADALPLLRVLAEHGADLVVGSRPSDRVERGAMTWPQQVGSRLVAGLISVLWGQRVTDLGPFRAIRWASLQRLEMADRSYGWTVEMQVKALQRGMRVVEVPVRCRVRVGKSKVSGTLRGVVGAAVGMLGMVLRLWWSEARWKARPCADLEGCQ